MEERALSEEEIGKMVWKYESVMSTGHHQVEQLKWKKAAHVAITYHITVIKRTCL